MADERMLMEIAVVLATKAAQGVAEGGRAAVSALVNWVRRKLGEQCAAQEALAAAEADPGDDVRIRALRDVLEQLTVADPEFAAELRRRWSDVSQHATNRGGGVVNQISGGVGGNVVQARDVHGGISFGGTGRGAAPSGSTGGPAG